MSRNKDSLQQTVIVALLLCIVCSVIVSAAAVLLKPLQSANKEFERSRNVLAAAGLYDASHSKEEVLNAFSAFSFKLVDLEKGNYLTGSEINSLGIDLATFDQKKAAKTEGISIELSGTEDIAGIKRRSRYAGVYVLENNGRIEKIILPVHGYGLWSTLYGFLAVDGSGNDVQGLTFYSHAETPGLGGEVDNPSWKALWVGKKIYNANGDVALTVIKGKAPEGHMHNVDGLSGATLTSRGVANLIQYWMGEGAFGLYLSNVQKGEV